MPHQNNRTPGFFQRIADCPKGLLRILLQGFFCSRILSVFRKLHIKNRMFHFTSLYIHGKVQENRTFPSCCRNVISFVQFFYDLLRFTDLYTVFRNRLCHGNNINFLKSLLTQSRNPLIFIRIQLPCEKYHRQRIKISIRHSRKQIDRSRSARSICTGTAVLCLRITACCKRCPLFIVTGMIICLRILLYRIHKMRDHGSLISKEIMNSLPL